MHQSIDMFKVRRLKCSTLTAAGSSASCWGQSAHRDVYDVKTWQIKWWTGASLTVSHLLSSCLHSDLRWLVHIMSLVKNSSADNECVGGRFLSSAALIYVCVFPEESAVSLVLVCVCVWECVYPRRGTKYVLMLMYIFCLVLVNPNLISATVDLDTCWEWTLDFGRDPLAYISLWCIECFRHRTLSPRWLSWGWSSPQLVSR